jgi:hypothetical protein
MMIKHFLFTLNLLLISASTFSQVAEVKIEELSRIRLQSDFEQMNEREQRWDELSVGRLNKTIEELQASGFYRDSLSEEAQKDAVQQLRSYAVIYSENRSRCVMTECENGIARDTVRWNSHGKAKCFYTDSTFNLLTGFGIFGGTYFSLELRGERLNSLVNFDLHRETVFKAQRSDTVLQSRIDVPFLYQALQIDREPAEGEQLNGRLLFETPVFYRSSEFDPYLSKDDYDPASVNEIRYTGELEFTCKVLDPQKRIDW